MIKNEPVEKNMMNALKNTVKRRGFLASAGVAGAAGVAAVAIPVVSTPTIPDATASDGVSKGYQLTEKVKQYYRTTTI